MELHRLAVKFEGIMNSRPITNDINRETLTYLTPAMLINGKNTINENIENYNLTSSKEIKLKKLNKIQDKFWKRY
jgi:hypothetical protein